MGLDAVELVMEIEEEFGIRLSETECINIRTAGEAFDCVMRKLATSKESIGSGAGVCASRSAFYRLRRVVAECGAVRETIRPAAHLKDVFPRRGRQQHWRRLADSLGIWLPSLKRPDWLVALSFSIAFTAPLMIALLLVKLDLKLAALSLPSSFAAIAILLVAITAPLATEPPFLTVGALVGELASIDQNALAFARNAPNDDEIWSRMQGIISEQLCVPREVVTKDARFVEDLGCD